MSLSVRFRKKLNNGKVLDVNFSCDSEDGCCALLGEADSGKSMALYCIAGLERPEEGRMELDGEVLFDSLHHVNVPAKRRHIGLLGADGNLDPSLTVEENIRKVWKKRHWPFSPRLRKARKQALLTRTTSYLHEFGLDGLGGLHPADLSATQRLRAGLCRIMAAEPRVVLLDDAFAQLDSYDQARLLMDVRDKLAKKKVPVVFASRSREEVFAMSRQVCVLHDGKSQPLEWKEEFFAHPKTISAALLSGVCNVSDIHLLNQTHVVSNDWRMIFCRNKTTAEPVDHKEDNAAKARRQETFSQDKNSEEDIRREVPSTGETANKDTGSGAREKITEEEAAFRARQERDAMHEEARRKHRQELKEDLERSLRFELVHVEAEPKLPLQRVNQWQEMPEDVCAVGIRPDAFQTRRPEGRFYTFRVHAQKIEEGLSDWKVYFLPFAPTDKETERFTEGDARILLWQLPRGGVDRVWLEQQRVLYVPEEKLLYLKKG